MFSLPIHAAQAAQSAFRAETSQGTGQGVSEFKYNQEKMMMECEPKPSKPGARYGKKFVGGYFDPLIHKEIKKLAAEEAKTTQELMEEAVSALLKSRNVAIDLPNHTA